ncbi:hypothetical protein AB0K16_21820 [Nonomuraea jabiensis]|uniref:hypothetical protein n=1 Tax=Nonomuraea jabiensis TaxID=882448 RepID=UPI00342FAB31
MSLVFTCGSLVTATIGGWLSDRLGRRKVFVLVASLIMGAGLLTLGFTTTYPQCLGAAFTAALVFAVLGALTVIPIRKVR